MANPYFRCKEFIVYQEHAAMKVCTDACAFGAWMNQSWEKKCSQGKAVAVEVGTGTGLLSLMFMKLPCNENKILYTYEIDEDACKDARKNIQENDLEEKIILKETDFREAEQPLEPEVIFSNPPFFEGNLKSINPKRNRAMHSTNLGMEELFKKSSELQQEQGLLYLMIPSHRLESILQMASPYQYTLQEIGALYHHKDSETPFRHFLCFQKTDTTNQLEGLQSQFTPINIPPENFYIREGKQLNEYSAAFQQLMQPYYLNL